MPIRLACSGDSDKLLRIEREVLLSGALSQYSFEDLEKWERSLSVFTYADAIAAGQVFVAVSDNGGITGFARFDPKQGIIHDLCVWTPYEGKGVGRSLVRECLVRARGAGLQEVAVTAPLDAVEFYEHLDFEAGDTSFKILPDGTPIAMAVMSRPVVLPVVQDQIECLQDSVQFFAPNKDRNYRLERIAVESFLRGLDVKFGEEDLTRGDDPPDVCFREARFEVKTLYDEHRTMHRDFKEMLAQARNTLFSSELMKRYTPRDITLGDLIQKVIDVVLTHGATVFADKHGNIDFGKRGTTDFLVNVNLQHIERVEPSVWPDLSLLELQGWRSVSFTRGLATSCVLTAHEDAPEFLKQAQGALRRGRIG